MSVSSATATISSSRSGVVERTAAVGPDCALEFPDGLPGFAAHRRFRLEPERIGGGRFMRLQSLESAELGFLVLPIDPGQVMPSADDLEEARLDRAIAVEDLVVLLVVALRPASGAWEISANLRAPVFIDGRRRMGWQIVLRDPSYPVRQPLLPVS